MTDGAPQPNSFSVWVRWFPVTVAYTQAVAIMVIAVWTALGIAREGSDLRPIDIAFEFALYLAGAVAMVWIGKALSKTSPRAVAPFVVAQFFVLIFAWDLLQSSQVGVQTVGLLIGATGLGAAVLLVGFRRWL